MNHEIIRDLHNLTRWLIVASALYALFISYRGLNRGDVWTVQAQRAGLLFTTALYIQLLLCIPLYLVSPLIDTAWSDFGLALTNTVQRFFTVQHPVQMFSAIVVAQVGYSVAKRAQKDRARYQYAALYYTLAVVLIATAIPWPFLEYGRPLWPEFAWSGE